MGRTVLLEIPPRSDHLVLVRRVVATAADLHGVLADRRIDDLSLAVSEACANAIDAQRPVGSEAPIEIAVDLDPKAVVVTVTDHAGGFSPDAVDPLPAADDPVRLRHERGLGLPLMRSLADAVTFRRTRTGTAVRIEMHEPPTLVVAGSK